MTKTIEEVIEEHISSFVDQVLVLETVEEAFQGFIIYSDEHELHKKKTIIVYVTDFWSKLPQDGHESAIPLLVGHFHRQRSPKRAKRLIECLEILVERNSVTSKFVCESLVNNDKLDYRKSTNWCLTFQLIRKIVDGVDYKGCRDLLKNVLEKCMSIPSTDNASFLEQVHALESVIVHILDRDACLLPAYFAVNEITKLCPDDRPPPHWKIGELLSGFVQTFRATARMVSVAGRGDLLPIVGHSSGTVNSWKLNPTTLRFSLSGPLPYDKELMESQTALLRYVLEQPYSKDMICTMLSLSHSFHQGVQMALPSEIAHFFQMSE